MASSGMGIGRPTSPDTAKNIWSSIEQMAQRGEVTTVDNIAERMGHYFNWNTDECRMKIYEAVDSGLLIQSRDNPPVYSVPMQERVSVNLVVRTNTLH